MCYHLQGKVQNSVPWKLEALVSGTTKCAHCRAGGKSQFDYDGSAGLICEEEVNIQKKERNGGKNNDPNTGPKVSHRTRRRMIRIDIRGVVESLATGATSFSASSLNSSIYSCDKVLKPRGKYIIM